MSRWIEVALVLAVAAGVFWPALGYSGFAFSEGHRVFTGWDMVHHHDWLVPRLMDQPYLRKPPGMPWIVAVFSLLFGESEYSARAVSALSATLSAFVCYFFANRWFGRPYGLLAGIAFSLTPLFWSPGRSAEIESLHNLLTLGACSAALDLLMFQTRAGGAFVGTVLLGASATGMLLVKGPAGVPCVGGVLIGACIGARSLRPLLSPHLWAALALAVTAAGYVGWRIIEHAGTLPLRPVLQSADSFLWNSNDILRIIFLPLVSLAAAFPLVLALPLAIAPIKNPDRPAKVGLALCWTILASLFIYAAVGVSNNRYTMPAATLMPLVFAFAARRLSRGMAPVILQRLSRLVLLHRPGLWAVLLVFGAASSIVWSEVRRANRTSGQKAGYALADELAAIVIEPTIEVWGDKLIDTRPEVVYYAAQRAAALGRDLHPRWVPADHSGSSRFPVPPPGGFLLLMEYGGGPSNEVAAYKQAGILDTLEEVSPDSVHAVHKFTFRVYRVPPAGGRFVGPPDNGGGKTPQIVTRARTHFVCAFFSCGLIRRP